MALSTLHVACGYAGGYARKAQVILALSGPISWSEQPASGTPTTGVAGEDSIYGTPLMEVVAPVDVWVATGKNPNASQSPRRFIYAGTSTTFFVNDGDRLAWIAA